MTKTIEDITNFIFIGKSIEELSHYDLLIINADWVEEQLSKDIRIMKDKNIIDDNTVFIICEGHQLDNNRSSANILINYLKKENINNKIKNKALFEVIQKFVINNFGSVISIGSIHEYMFKNENINVDRRTIKKYIEILEKAKIIYSCDLFDIKSKKVLDGEKKYYLADLSIYFALNTDNRINYGPVLENVLYSYLKSKNYTLSVGKIGNLECDFIARRGIDEYFYIQVSKNIDDEKTEKREYKPFYEIKEMYPRYLFVLDLILQKNII